MAQAQQGKVPALRLEGITKEFVGKVKANDNINLSVDHGQILSVLGENGALDIEKVHPVLYAPENRAYYGVGQYLGKAFFIGKQMKSH